MPATNDKGANDTIAHPADQENASAMKLTEPQDAISTKNIASAKAVSDMQEIKCTMDTTVAGRSNQQPTFEADSGTVKVHSTQDLSDKEEILGQ